jgi:hypothetical protein
MRHFNPLQGAIPRSLLRTQAMFSSVRYPVACCGVVYARYGNAAIPLFVIADTKNLLVFSTDVPMIPMSGQRLISLVPAGAEQISAAL